MEISYSNITRSWVKKRDGTHYLQALVIKYYLDKIRGIVFSHHHDTCLLILVNDRYDLPFSLKDDERGRMASQHLYIQNIYPRPGDVFPGPSEVNSAMANSGNKLRLQKIVKEALKLKAGRLRRELVYCEGATSFH